MFLGYQAFDLFTHFSRLFVSHQSGNEKWFCLWHKSSHFFWKVGRKKVIHVKLFKAIVWWFHFFTNVITIATNNNWSPKFYVTRRGHQWVLMCGASTSFRLPMLWNKSSKVSQRWVIIALSHNAPPLPARRRTWNSIGSPATCLWRTNGTKFWSAANRTQNTQKFAVSTSLKLTITSLQWVSTKVFWFFHVPLFLSMLWLINTHFLLKLLQNCGINKDRLMASHEQTFSTDFTNKQLKYLAIGSYCYVHIVHSFYYLSGYLTQPLCEPNMCFQTYLVQNLSDDLDKWFCTFCVHT